MLQTDINLTGNVPRVSMLISSCDDESVTTRVTFWREKAEEAAEIGK